MPGYNTETALSNMLVYNMLDGTFRNQTVDGIPRAEGVMLYIPAGDAGMLVYFGGIQQPYENSTKIGVSNLPINFVCKLTFLGPDGCKLLSMPCIIIRCSLDDRKFTYMT